MKTASMEACVKTTGQKDGWINLLIGWIGEALVFVISSIKAVTDSMAAARHDTFTTQQPDACEDGEEAASPEL